MKWLKSEFLKHTLKSLGDITSQYEASKTQNEPKVQKQAKKKKEEKKTA